MNIKITNTGSVPVHYVRQVNESTPRVLSLSPGESIKGHAVTYNADKRQIILVNRGYKAYFEIQSTVTHSVE